MLIRECSTNIEDVQERSYHSHRASGIIYATYISYEAAAPHPPQPTNYTVVVPQL